MGESSMRSVVLAMVVAAGLTGCASGLDASAPASVYEPREVRTGSNIPTRERRPVLTPEERERAQAEAQAIRDGANRENLPRPTGSSR